jgi:hypothetical protein
MTANFEILSRPLSDSTCYSYAGLYPSLLLFDLCVITYLLVSRTTTRGIENNGGDSGGPQF